MVIVVEDEASYNTWIADQPTFGSSLGDAPATDDTQRAEAAPASEAEESAATQAAEESAAADQAAAFGFGGSTDLPAEESEYREDTAVDPDGNPI